MQQADERKGEMVNQFPPTTLTRISPVCQLYSNTTSSGGGVEINNNNNSLQIDKEIRRTSKATTVAYNMKAHRHLATIDSDGNTCYSSDRKTTTFDQRILHSWSWRRGAVACKERRLENTGVDRLGVKFGHNAEPVTNKRPPVFERPVRGRIQSELLLFVRRHFGGLQR
ncbi:hypothetical protein T05_12266 [Trichinella murrelli]|uniref:Uncharacterized protein n=1 Tax=Trichinella murrelli TaxID=144512 RepID=A0A0V0UDG6_9BILA|nr:hypothetical protein T05_12266 [Trichinella murrelli]